MHISLESKPVAAAYYAQLENRIAAVKKRRGYAPALATVLVGEDPASQIYVSKKGEMCAKLGLGHQDFKLSANATEKELLELVTLLNADKRVDGILVQRPMPKQINESRVLDAIDPRKDVDCFSPANVGYLAQGRGKLLPCTPAGAMEILNYFKIDIAGKNALVVGRSDIVGKPMGMLLLQANATVAYAHSKTKDLPSLIAWADIVVAAIGRAHFLGGDLPWKKNAVVIDVGINRREDKKVVGDVDFAAVSKKVSAITPVPGGVGPMTIALLMGNTVRAAEEILNG